MQVRTILDAAPFEAKFHSAPLVLQFSSLSSPGTKPEWIGELVRSFCDATAACKRSRRRPATLPTGELVRSFCGARPSPSAIEVVFPTQAQVGEILEGWLHANAHDGAPPLFPQVGESLEGWYAGNSIPCEVQNVERLRCMLIAC